MESPVVATAVFELCIEIGGMPISIRTESSEFARLLHGRYGSFVVGADHTKGKGPKGEEGKWQPTSPSSEFPVSNFELEVELVPPGVVTDAQDARVRRDGERWIMERADFRAEWDPERGRGWVRQTANPYSIDSVLRILHSLLLAREGGFLVHAASAIRNGQAFLFAGVSGAGKTTISHLAPPDAVLLTDEISYVRQVRSQAAEPLINRQSYVAFGTPFAGELARIGENRRAPVAALYLLAQGRENRIEPVSDAEAGRALLQNILFFAQDADLVRLVFQSAVDFVSCVPIRRLVFVPDASVWNLITWGSGVGGQRLEP